MITVLIESRGTRGKYCDVAKHLGVTEFILAKMQLYFFLSSDQFIYIAIRIWYEC